MATGKKGSSAPAGEQKQKKPAYEVHIDKTFDDPGKSLRAVASMTIGDFAVHGVKLFQNENGTFVLSEQSVAIKIQHLMQLLSVQPDIEIICSDARENFEYNKLSLARRAEKETNLKVQLLLRKDMKFLDDIQLQMSTAREFMFAYRVQNANDQSFATLNRLEKQINDQGFDCRRATKDDIKRILSRYFGHMTEDAIDDVDGERMIKKWIIPD